MLTFWCNGVKIVDFGYPGQLRETQPVILDGLARKVIYLIGGLAGHWEGNLVAWLATGKVIYLIGSLAGQLTCCIGDSGCQKIDILMPFVSPNHS